MNWTVKQMNRKVNKANAWKSKANCGDGEQNYKEIDKTNE